MKNNARMHALVAGIVLATLAGCTGERTVYHQAEKGEHRDLVRRLVVEEGQDVNQRDEETGLTPLQIAVIEGHQEMAKALLRLGADPNVLDKAGRTPLDHAYALGHDDIAELLIEHGAAGVAKVEVTSTPPGARIMLDGEYLGETPLDVVIPVRMDDQLLEAYPPADRQGFYAQRRVIQSPVPQRVLFDMRLQPSDADQIEIEIDNELEVDVW